MVDIVAVVATDKSEVVEYSSLVVGLAVFHKSMLFCRNNCH